MANLSLKINKLINGIIIQSTTKKSTNQPFIRHLTGRICPFWGPGTEFQPLAWWDAIWHWHSGSKSKHQERIVSSGVCKQVGKW